MESGSSMDGGGSICYKKIFYLSNSILNLWDLINKIFHSIMHIHFFI